MESNLWVFLFCFIPLSSAKLGFSWACCFFRLLSRLVAAFLTISFSMHSFSSLTQALFLALIAVAIVNPIHALPTLFRPRGIFDSISPLDSVLLFDAPAFQDPTNAQNLIASLEAYVSLRQIDIPGFSAALSAGLSAVGLGADDASISTALNRLSLFPTLGLGGKTLNVKIDGCNQEAVVNSTSGLPDLGITLQNVSIGSCGSTSLQGGQQLIGLVDVDAIDNRQFTATIFPSPPDGFGIISGWFSSSSYREGGIH